MGELRAGVLVDEREAAGLHVLEALSVPEAVSHAARARQLHDSAVLSRLVEGAGGAAP